MTESSVCLKHTAFFLYFNVWIFIYLDKILLITCKGCECVEIWLVNRRCYRKRSFGLQGKPYGRSGGIAVQWTFWNRTGAVRSLHGQI